MQRWAHRSVCTSRQEDLVTFFAYPANAGHDYGTIERQGFRIQAINTTEEGKVIEALQVQLSPFNKQGMRRAASATGRWP